MQRAGDKAGGTLMWRENTVGLKKPNHILKQNLGEGSFGGRNHVHKL